MEEKKLITEARVTMLMRDGESEENAADRFYNLLYNGVCNAADHHVNFEILSQKTES